MALTLAVMIAHKSLGHLLGYKKQKNSTHNMATSLEMIPPTSKKANNMGKMVTLFLGQEGAIENVVF